MILRSDVLGERVCLGRLSRGVLKKKHRRRAHWTPNLKISPVRVLNFNPFLKLPEKRHCEFYVVSEFL